MVRIVTARILRDPPEWRAGVNVDCEDARAEARRDRDLEAVRRAGCGDISVERAYALMPRRWRASSPAEGVQS